MVHPFFDSGNGQFTNGANQRAVGAEDLKSMNKDGKKLRMTGLARRRPNTA